VGKYLIVLAGAGLGGVARFAAGSWVMARYGGRFPLGTLAVNVSGSFFAGLLMVLLTEYWQPHPYWRLFLIIGVLGGYTTFSSLEYETYQAIRDGERWLGLVYMLSSVTAGYLAVWLGALVAARR
jgi:fluoride exporter